MHHIFKLDEIIRLVVGELVNSDSNSAALSLACSCRCLSDPVLDTMWEEGQTDLVKLLKTFPSSAGVVKDGTFVSSRNFSSNVI